MRHRATSLPRACFGVALLALSACAAPLPVATPAAPAAPSPAGAHAPSDPPVPPGAPAGPVVVIGSEQVTLDGKRVISRPDLDRLETPRKIDALYETPASSRAAWQAAHAGEAAPCTAALVVAPGTPGRAFLDAYLTLSLAGFAKISVAVDGRYVATHGQAPCSASEIPIRSEPRPRVLHLQADEHRWRLRVPREAHTTLSGNLPPEVGPCVDAIFESLIFQAPEGGVVTVMYPIQFSPGP